ncbi:Crp/Fnr family transcriptional regulator [Ekhidna sp.]|uniref:Crp/Fnr family transcriptional regulator n=1 Tax=Ekhidna sp. TaxID=2608089 RepID=UPI003B50855E
MIDQVIKSIHSFAELTEKEIEVFVSKLQLNEYKKGESLLSIGEINRVWGFIVKGSFREYYIDDELNEVTTNLFPVNHWVLNHQSFTGQKPSKVKIEAFENSSVYEINIHDLHNLIGNSPAYFALGKIIESVNINASFKGTPEEKYQLLIRSKPEIIKTFTLKYIASYLEMTPETLSRVRNKIR